MSADDREGSFTRKAFDDESGPEHDRELGGERDTVDGRMFARFLITP